MRTAALVGVAFAAGGVVITGADFLIRAYLNAGPDSATERWLVPDHSRSADTLTFTPTVDFTKQLKNSSAGYVDWQKASVSVYSIATKAAAPSKPTTSTATAPSKPTTSTATAPADPATPTGNSTAATPPPTQSGWDPYRWDRTLIATVVKGTDAMPGDRLLWTRIFIRPVNFTFVDYTIAATDNQTVKVADLESTHDRKINIDATLEAAGVPKQTVSAALDKQQKTTSELSDQYEKLGVDIQPDILRIVRESAKNGDVVGNSSVTLSIQTDPDLIYKGQSVVDEKGQPVVDEKGQLVIDKMKAEPVLLVTAAHLSDGAKSLSPSNAQITILPELRLPHCALKADVWMLYETRHITSGRSHYSEGMHQVELIQDAFNWGGVIIVPADEVNPAKWAIRVIDQQQNTPATKVIDPQRNPPAINYLTAQVENGNKRQIVFTDYAVASELTHWLKLNQPKSTKNAQVKLSNMIFDFGPGQTLIPERAHGVSCK